jgi:hypothetical protein
MRAAGSLPGLVALKVNAQNPPSVPVRASREGEGWRAKGAIAVHDEVQVEFDHFLAPVQ